MYKCVTCNFNTSTLFKIIKHLKIHSNLPNYSFKCPSTQCKCIYKSYSSLKNHYYRSHHNRAIAEPVDELIYECNVVVCQKKLKTRALLISHLRQHIKDGENIECPFINCVKTFHNLNTFAVHLTRIHNDSNSRLKITYNDNDNDNDIPLNDFDTLDEPMFSNVDCISNFTQFILKLQTKHHVQTSVIDSIISEIFQLLEMTTTHLTNEVSIILKEIMSKSSPCLNDFNQIISVIKTSSTQSPFNPSNGELRSIQTRKTIFKNNFRYVEPVAYKLGEKGKHFHYIPIKETLKALFKDRYIEHFLWKNSENEKLLDYNDGLNFRSNSFFSENKNALQIILYQDAFEIVNPIGSAKKKHKLLAVYYSLGNLNSCARSSVDSIQLVLLCNENEFKKMGNDGPSVVFKPLLRDLKELESDGIDLGQQYGVQKGSVVYMVGDNLGSHMIGGFVENFTISNFCRFCLFEKEDLAKNIVFSKNYIPRTKENYEDHAKTCFRNGLIHHRGVKYNSILNDLSHFHVMNPGLPPCLGHDLFEGIVKIDMEFIIYDLVQYSKFFNLKQLNTSISNLKLKGNEARDRPCILNGFKLCGHAIQIWNFVRFFPILVGHFITNVNNKAWQLFLTLKKLIDYVCKPSYTKLDIVLMNDAIVDYFSLRPSVISGNLKPKHHFITHYPHLTLQCGPLINLWTMRFESKHSYFKQCIRSSRNFINVTKSLAEKHQYLQAYYSTGSLFHLKIAEVKESLPFDQTLYSDNVTSSFIRANIILNTTSCFTCKSIIYQNISYNIGSIVIFDEVFPQNLKCGIIKLIVVDDNRVVLVLEMLLAKYLPDFGIFTLEYSDIQYRAVNIENLRDKYPLNSYKFKDKQCIILKHFV